ncbi:hypothetical protein BC2926_38810 [Bacillus cereus]|nr:hypothetical protein BC2926_38810 [Bacillus cereus]
MTPEMLQTLFLGVLGGIIANMICNGFSKGRAWAVSYYYKKKDRHDDDLR